METKISKTNSMETTIYHNADKTASDLAKVHQVQNYMELALSVLTERKIDPEQACNVLQGRFGDIQSRYIETESAKLEAASALLGGANALLDVAREKIKTDAAKLILELKEKIKPINWEMHQYLQCFEFLEGKWTLRNDYEADIKKLNSIVLTEPAESELYQKHVKLVELLNELKGDAGTLNGIINNLVRFNATTKEFSINYRHFDKNNVVPSYL